MYVVNILFCTCNHKEKRMLQLNQFFIQLQNAQSAHKQTLIVPFSPHIWECAQVLQSLGVFQDVTWTSRKNTKMQKCWHNIHCTLRYDSFGPIMRRVELCTTPGRQFSWSYAEVVQETAKPGHLLLLTEHGILTETEALRSKIGGIPLCRLFFHLWRS